MSFADELNKNYNPNSDVKSEEAIQRSVNIYMRSIESWCRRASTHSHSIEGYISMGTYDLEYDLYKNEEEFIEHEHVTFLGHKGEHFPLPYDLDDYNEIFYSIHQRLCTMGFKSYIFKKVKIKESVFSKPYYTYYIKLIW